MDRRATSRPASDRRTRPYGSVGVLVLAVGLLVAGNLLALRAESVFAADAGGFIVFVNAIGLLAMTSIAVGAVIRWRVPHHPIGPLLFSRTTGWAIVTGSLVAVLLVGVVAFQSLLADVVQGGGTLAVAASTLVAYALFQPVRRRVQVAVDRRFDRADYNTERAELRSVVGQAVRPTASGIWLHESGRR